MQQSYTFYSAGGEREREKEGEDEEEREEREEEEREEEEREEREEEEREGNASTVKKEMKCSGDFEILQQIVRDTTQNRESMN